MGNGCVYWLDQGDHASLSRFEKALEIEQ